MLDYCLGLCFLDAITFLQSLALGYRNMVAPIACAHGGMDGASVTARGVSYQTWLQKHNLHDAELYQRNEALLAKIWEPCLPLYVTNPGFAFACKEPFTDAPTGRDIVGYDWKAVAA